MLALRVVAPLLLTFPGPVFGQTCDVLHYRARRCRRMFTSFWGAEGTSGIVNGNIVAIIGKRAILLVDAGQFPTPTRQVLAELRKLSPAPVRYLVNAHCQGDHLLANFVVERDLHAFDTAALVALAQLLGQIHPGLFRRSMDGVVVIPALFGYGIAAEINAHQPGARAARDDLPHLAGHETHVAFLRKNRTLPAHN